MEAEPVMATTTTDADMTIDYDQPQEPVVASSIDAEMGTAAADASVLPATTTTTITDAAPSLIAADVEAEMQDDGVLPTAGVLDEPEMIMIEAEIDSDLAPPASLAVDVPFANAEETDPVTSSVEENIATAVTDADLPDSAPNATLAPEPVLPPSASIEENPIAEDVPGAASGEPVIEAGDETERGTAGVEETLVTSVGDGGAAARDLDLENEPAAATTADEIADTTAERPAGEEATVNLAQVQEQPEPVEAAELASALAAQNAQPAADSAVPPLFAIATEKLSEQLPEAHADSDAASSAQHARPAVEKDPLLQVQLPADLFGPEASTSTARLAPGVLLTCGGTTYCLFRQLQVASETSFTDEDGDAAEGEDPAGGGGEVDAPLVLAAMKEHALYYEPVEKLVQTLRETLPELDGEADELVLDFEDLGITIGEDNIYARQASLFDFDRLHLGCQIPNRLHARIYAQPRFASGFNALAQHIASTYSPSASEEGGQPLEGEGDEMQENIGEGEEEDEEEEGAGIADDYDGPDSELPVVSASGEDEGGGEEEGEGEDDEFDLESALAQLDQDNIVAVVEGAQEDLLLDPSEDDPNREAGEEEQGAEPEVDGEGDAQQQQEEGEEAGENDEIWQVVETEEAVETSAAVVGAAEGEEEAHAEEEGEAAQVVEELAAKTAVEATSVEHDQVALKHDASAEGGAAPVDNNGVAEEESATAVAAAASAGACLFPFMLRLQEPGLISFLGRAEIEDGEATAAAADPSDVVIDYDEAFDPSSSAAAVSGVAPAETSTTTAEENANGFHDGEAERPASPKRSRSFDAVEGREQADEDLATDAKRPRLSENEGTDSAETEAPTATMA
ncbi:hypothetical protein JCM10908_005873 [Rhodotorula pacifica]|uniref:uncharacterized protein n=1 Tax=Rhodotorula pacifica TaxID=1495444 RepID=UPI0031720CB8